MRGISIKGIVIAIAAVLVVDIVAGIALTIALSKGQPEAALVVSTPFLLGSLIFGTLSTVLGGYIAARVAKAHHYINSAILGGLGLLVGLLAAGEYPLWFNAAGFFSVLPAALLGGQLAKRTSEINA